MGRIPSFLAHPDLFFKYYAFGDQTTRDRVKAVFLENSVYFPAPTQLNDPFDSAIRPLYDGSEEDWKAWLAHKLRARYPQMTERERLWRVQRAAREHRFSQFPAWVEKMRVFCMSKRCDHLLMWAHYAQSHTGLCLVFDGANEFFGRAQEIKYAKDYPKVQYLRASKQQITQATLLTKAGAWRYEKEWRVVEYEKGPGPYRFPPETLVGVIFGYKMPATSKQVICQWCVRRARRPRIFHARPAEREFRLILKDITSVAYL
jgi:hypothetical protein